MTVRTAQLFAGTVSTYSFEKPVDALHYDVVLVSSHGEQFRTARTDVRDAAEHLAEEANERLHGVGWLRYEVRTVAPPREPELVFSE